MPELPEVENVCRNLSELIPIGSKIKVWQFFRADLRFKPPKASLSKLSGKSLEGIRRRAKYILMHFENKVLISHLGMTGSWRLAEKDWIPQKHDHLAFTLKKGGTFVYADPRRFGFIEVVDEKKIIKRFRNLGVEPLDTATDFRALTKRFSQIKAPIKNALMNQKFVVGVGNIYAAEALFAAGISPFRGCSKITQIQYEKMWKELVRILNKAVFMGGSTIENYRNGFGEEGEFQSELWVYGKAGEACRRCRAIVISENQAGRSSFWCPGCQK